MKSAEEVANRFGERTGLFATLNNANALVFGCEQLGGFGWGQVDVREVSDAIAFALDAGIVAFDTADCYGPYISEQRLGDALAGVRNSAIICTKFGVRIDAQGRRRNDSSPNWCREALEGSLRRLRVEHIDLYQMHCHDGHTPIEETVGTLSELRVRGLIRSWGLCNVAPEFVPESVWAACEALQSELSLLTPYQAAPAIETCTRGIQILAYGVLGQGLLSGRYDTQSRFGADDRRSYERYRNFHGARLASAMKLLAELNACANLLGCSASILAIAWVRSLDCRIWPLVGIKRRAHVSDALRAVALQVPAAIHARLSAASSAFEARLCQ